MATLPTRSKDAIVATIAAAMQGRVSKFLNFATGSVFLAFAEAKAGVALWLQAEILRVLKITRAATSEADDLDSFMADYTVTRLPAVAASGLVTFGRYTAAATSILIPVGALVQTGDGNQRFAVYADSSRESYRADQGGYMLAAGLPSLDLPVRAMAPGLDGNVGAGSISLASSSISGVDFVANAAALSGGASAETDEALRSRFQLFFDSLSKGTETAIRYVIRSLGVGVTCQIMRHDPNEGQPFLTVIVDDGSGSPPDELVSRALSAVREIQAAGVWIPVIGASSIIATVALQIDVAGGFRKQEVAALATTAITRYINSLGLGQPLRYTRIENVVYGASPGVTNVTAVKINSETSDLIPTLAQTIKPGAIVVS